MTATKTVDISGSTPTPAPTPLILATANGGSDEIVALQPDHQNSGVDTAPPPLILCGRPLPAWAQSGWLLAKPYFYIGKSKRDFVLAFYVFLFFMAGMIITGIGNSYIDRIYNSPDYDLERLPDPLLDATEDWFLQSGMDYHMSDTLVVIAGVLMSVRVAFLQRQTLTIARRMMVAIASLFVLRAVCIFLTILPSPMHKCESQPVANYFFDAILVILRIRIVCGDVFYSGHTIFFTLCSMIWLFFPVFPDRLPVYYSILPSLLVASFNLFGMISLVFSTLHYTIDVLISAVLTTMFWYLLWYWTEHDSIKFGTWLGRLHARWDDPEWPESYENWRTRQAMLQEADHLEKATEK